MKVVIAEGPDGVGKTTWAKQEAAHRRWAYIPPLGSAPREKLLAHTLYALGPGKSRIVDRLLLSELVYSRFYNRPQVDIDFGHLVEETRLRGNELSVVLFLRPPKLRAEDEHLAPRWEELRELYLTVGVSALWQWKIPFLVVTRWEDKIWWF